jgi:sulfite exporter TauE/SafE
MCGGFATACARTRGGLPLWHLGRLATYMGLGALAAVAGRILSGPAWIPALVASGLIAWFCLALAGLVPELRLSPDILTRGGSAALASPSAGAQLLFGMLNGLIPCGLVYAALAIPHRRGSRASSSADDKPGAPADARRRHPRHGPVDHLEPGDRVGAHCTPA